MSASCYIAILAIGLSMPVSSTKPIRAATASQTDQCNDQYTCSEDSCALWEYLTIGWFQPVLNLGSKKELMEEDMCEPSSTLDRYGSVLKLTTGQISPYLVSETVYRNFTATRKSASLLRALMADSSLDLFLHISLGMMKATFDSMTPIAFGKLLQHLANPSKENQRAAFSYSVVILVAKFGFAQCEIIRESCPSSADLDMYSTVHPDLYHGRRAAFRLRSTVIALLAEKLLKRKDMAGALQKTEGTDTKIPASASAGKVQNLVCAASFLSTSGSADQSL